MVDEVEFRVIFPTLTQANEEILKMGPNAVKSTSILEKAYKKVEQRFNKNLTNVRKQITVSKNLENQRQKAAATAVRASYKQARAERELRKEFQQGFMAFDLARRSIRKLNQAKRAGIITTSQYENEISQLRQEYHAFQNQTDGLNSAQNRFANQLRTGSIRSTNNLGVVAQQTGFQVGDFLVQIQSGANGLMAFGQQATQLVGILPLLQGSVGLSSKALLSLSVGLGIGIPLVTALAGAMMRASGESETFEDKLNNLSSAIDDFVSNSRNMTENLDEIREKYGSATREFIKLEERMQKIRLQEIILGAAEASEKLSESMSRFRSASANLESLFNLSDLGDITQTEEALGRLVDKLESVGSSDTISEQVQAAQGLSNEILQITGGVENMDREQLKFFKTVEETIASLKRAERVQKGFLGSVEATKDKAIELGDTILGLDFSNAVAGADRLLNRLQLAAIAAFEIAQNAAETNLRGRRVGRGRGQAAGPTAEEIQKNVPSAQLAFAPTFELPSAPGSKGGGSSGGGGGGTVSDPREFLKTLEKELQLKELLVGVGETQEQQLKLEAELKDNIAAQTEGLTAAQVVLNEKDKERIRLLTEQAEAIREAEAAEERRRKAIEDFENQLEDSITNIVKGADSIEDAFLGMISNIVEELFRQQVANPIAEGIGGILGGGSGGGGSFLDLFSGPAPGSTSSILGSANGNAFSGGRVMPFANGGVVSSPTLFPMRGSTTGLMGESGPEAIVPLKRGRDGKLGIASSGNSGGSVTVNQTFQFAANGDDSVKRIIAQEAPKIAQMTQKAIVDNRLRGGSMKSAFSG